MQGPPAWQTSVSGNGSVVHEPVGSHALRCLVMENDTVKPGVPAALPAAAVLAPGLGAPDGGGVL